MSSVIITKLSEKDIQDRGIKQWPIWEKEVSEFPWYYDSTEHCYILKGDVIVTTPDGEYRFGAGDFVTFPKGLSCHWKILEPVRKHYNFE